MLLIGVGLILVERSIWLALVLALLNRVFVDILASRHYCISVTHVNTRRSDFPVPRDMAWFWSVLAQDPGEKGSTGRCASLFSGMKNSSTPSRHMAVYRSASHFLMDKVCQVPWLLTTPDISRHHFHPIQAVSFAYQLSSGICAPIYSQLISSCFDA